MTVMSMAPHMLQHAGAGAEGDQHLDSTAILLPVESVIVADRYRKDLGDVEELSKSIAEIGLLNPITVREWHGGYRLVAGERRLTAFQSLGLAEIPARVARDIADARDALVAERDENTERKPMLPSEATALGIAIQEMEAPAARERQAHGQTAPGRNACVPGSTSVEPDKWGHKTRDIAAEAVGMSAATFARMKTLITTAADESEPEEVRKAAREAVEAIDQGAPVRNGYDRVKEVRRKIESVTVESRGKPGPKPDEELTDWHQSLAERYPTARAAFEAEGHTRYNSVKSFQGQALRAGAKYRFTEKSYAKHAAQSQDWLDRNTLSIEYSISMLAEIDYTTITPEQAGEALQRLASTRQLTRFIKTLKEISNVQESSAE